MVKLRLLENNREKHFTCKETNRIRASDDRMSVACMENMKRKELFISDKITKFFFFTILLNIFFIWLSGTKPI